jgi:hypothetical protein
MVPSVSPGNLFDRLVNDDTITVRWCTATDPVFYETFNRPMSDITLRQLIVAKAVDQINKNMGYLALFPFLVQPTVENASLQHSNIPIRMFWDMHVSLPAKWVNLRLARVDRLPGGSNGSGSYTGTLRFIFTANQSVEGSESSVETALFYADYQIDSGLTYQIAHIKSANTLTGFVATISAGEADTLAGTVTFQTQDTTLVEIASFLDFLVPDPSLLKSYWLVAALGSGSEDFAPTTTPHGTGILVASAYNYITNLDADILNWLTSINYPYDLDSSRQSSDNAITIPSGLFREFNLTAPAGDLPTGDVSGLHYPVWVRRIERDGASMSWYFATYNITDDAPDASTPVEFAKLVLTKDMVQGQVVSIEPLDNLLQATVNVGYWNQHLGRGHVVLSSKWSVVGGDKDDFFDSVPEISGGTTEVLFSRAATRISSFGVSRIPKYTPTKSQNQALRGSTDRGNSPIVPSDSNRYVCEQDEGLGEQVDFEAESGFPSHSAIDRFGYVGTRVHKVVKLVVEPDKTDTSGTYYTNYLLPRLTRLLGRPPVFADQWYNGINFLTFNGDSWIG